MIVERGSVADHEGFKWACKHQGFDGTWEQWLDLPLSERQEYENGAAGSIEPNTIVG